MKNFLKIFIILVVVLALGMTVYQVHSNLGVQFVAPTLENLQNNIRAILPKSAPCVKPIPYDIGSFDPKFGVSKEYFLSALSDAEAIWEKPQDGFSGKDFFTYAPGDSTSNVLKINLVYDSRQQATNNLGSLGIVVKDNKDSYDSLKIQFTALQAELNSTKSDYNARVQSFNQKQSSYEKEVIAWNAKGGAPKAEYDTLNAEMSALETESAQLQAEQTKINGMVGEINSMVVVLNHLADTLNLSVSKYNTVGSSLSESFEEGVYTSDGSNRKIDIYEFSNREKLVRVLAHELGHALGLDHVNDPKAIMYKLNQSNNSILSKADLAELKTKCEIK